MSKKLNLGCGKDIREGWVNLDSAALEGVDVVWDIEKQPLPFEDESFEEILCQDVLEHVEYIPILKDLHRILKKGGTVTIRVPHFTSKNNFIDPTHKKMFSIRTFDFFTQASLHDRSYYFDFAFTEIAQRKIMFTKKFYIHDYFIEPFINIHSKLQDIYESSGFSRMYPAENIMVTLRK